MSHDVEDYTLRVSQGLILLNAQPGYVKQARGLVSRALQKVFGRVPHSTRPFFIRYEAADATDLGKSCYRYVAALHQHEALAEVIAQMARQEGWDNPPVDIYSDENLVYRLDPEDLPYYRAGL